MLAPVRVDGYYRVALHLNVAGFQFQPRSADTGKMGLSEFFKKYFYDEERVPVTYAFGVDFQFEQLDPFEVQLDEEEGVVFRVDVIDKCGNLKRIRKYSEQ